MTEAPRTCVIGAGMAGLTTIKALSDRAVPYTCFECSDDVGGNWYFGNPNGWSAAYRSLHIDTSKKALEFRDFPLSNHYPDFLHHSQIHEYLRDYADAFSLRERIRFKRTVAHAERGPAGGWRITLEDGSESSFDALVVCNGHHWCPAYPDPPFPGRFDGEVMHSHDYVAPEEPIDLRGRRVLVVGIGNSAVDIASELSRKGIAERVTLSTRSGAWVVPKYIFGRPVDDFSKVIPWLPLAAQRRIAGALVRLVQGSMESYGLPKPNHRFGEAHPTVSSELALRLGSGDVTPKPNVAELMSDHVRFEDGTTEAFDVIIYATGYRLSFPFFDPDFISAPGNRLPLYKRIFKPDIDDLAFVGCAQALPTLFQFAEAQSKLVADWIAGDWALPSVEEMEAAIAADASRYTRHYSDRPRHTMQLLAALYERDLERKVIPAGRSRARRRGPGNPLLGRAERAELLSTEPQTMAPAPS